MLSSQRNPRHCSMLPRLALGEDWEIGRKKYGPSPNPRFSSIRPLKPSTRLDWPRLALDLGFLPRSPSAKTCSLSLSLSLSLSSIRDKRKVEERICCINGLRGSQDGRADTLRQQGRRQKMRESQEKKRCGRAEEQMNYACLP